MTEAQLKKRESDDSLFFYIYPVFLQKGLEVVTGLCYNVFVSVTSRIII